MKTAAQAATKYGINGGAATAAQAWSDGFTADVPGILDKAIAAGPRWQLAVQDPQSLINLRAGLNRAKTQVSAIITKVTTVGKASFSAGVRAAATGNYLTFANGWMTSVGNEVLQLNNSNPRGDRAQNRARQAAYDAWVDGQAGKFRVK